VERYKTTIDKHHLTMKLMTEYIEKLPQPSRLVDSVIQQIHEHTVCIIPYLTLPYLTPSTEPD